MTVSANYPAIRPSLLLDFANTKQLDPRITFSRPTTATYYDGKTTAVAEQNLLLRSQEFDNAAWTKTSITVSSNSISAPDGTLTADTLEATSTFVSIVQIIVFSATPYSISVYAKAGTANWLRIGQSATTTHGAYFDVVNGTIGNVYGAGNTASITNAGNGWYRCTLHIASPLTSGQSVFYGQTDNNNSTAVTIGKTLSLWGAQLEQRSSVSSYTPTTTSPITNYIPALQTAAAGVPRFDHDPVTGESKGLLIEEQRTNLLTYSSEFNNTSWTTLNCSVAPSVNIAPDGTQTAAKAVASTSNVQHDVTQNTSTLSNSTNYTASVYVKAAGQTTFSLRMGNAAAWVTGGGPTFKFDLTAITATRQDGASASSSATIAAVGNGWYRCTVTGLTAASSASSSMRIYLIDYNAAAGDGTSGIYIWGAQLEAGSFPTSYIPTVASQVTRSADNASMTGANFSSWYRADEGTLYSEIKSINGRMLSINDISASNRILGYLIVSSTTLQAAISNNGTAQASWSNIAVSDAYAPNKLAVCYKVNDFAASANGGSVYTDTAGAVPIGVTQLQLGAESGFIGTGTIKRIAYYPARLSNANLQAITS